MSSAIGSGKVGDDYVCADCGDTFKQTVTDEDAKAEWETADPHNEFTMGDEDLERICDDCWQKLMQEAYDAGFPVPDTFKPANQNPSNETGGDDA